jgi:hypothetical protein
LFKQVPDNEYSVSIFNFLSLHHFHASGKFCIFSATARRSRLKKMCSLHARNTQADPPDLIIPIEGCSRKAVPSRLLSKSSTVSPIPLLSCKLLCFRDLRRKRFFSFLCDSLAFDAFFLHPASMRLDFSTINHFSRRLS